MHLPCHEHGREDGGEENRSNESIPTVLMEKSGRFPPRILGKMTNDFFHGETVTFCANAHAGP